MDLFPDQYKGNATEIPLPKRDIFVREICSRLGLCSQSRDSFSKSGITSSPDVRVTPVFGAKGYDFVRVSLIDSSNSPTKPETRPEDLFTYSENFKYRWTNMRLNSGLIKVTPGQTTTINIQGTDFNILLPGEGDGVRGVIIADPCISDKWVGCQFGSTLKTFDRITGFINAASELSPDKGGIDFWMILGDNFYDRTGELTTQFFGALSAKAKSKLFAASAGNHDYWVGGSPIIGDKNKDQFGNGFMQYYGMDTYASRNDSVNFLDFSQDPSKGWVILKENLPVPDNFQSYFKIGNLGFISYSGAYSKDKVDISSAYILGHWNDDGLGCPSGMEVPSIHASVENIEGCKGLGDKLGYFMGHTHCNVVKEKGLGFMVAGMGMEGCGNFGVPIVDSTSGTTKVYYYPIQDVNVEGSDKYSDVVGCFESKGVGSCQDLAMVWA
ncbi:hypothetical protein AAMO2058_000931900 [Amorphochlora amoebiformis]